MTCLLILNSPALQALSTQGHPCNTQKLSVLERLNSSSPFVYHTALLSLLGDRGTYQGTESQIPNQEGGKIPHLSLGLLLFVWIILMVEGKKNSAICLTLPPVSLFLSRFFYYNCLLCWAAGILAKLYLIGFNLLQTLRETVLYVFSFWFLIC